MNVVLALTGSSSIRLFWYEDVLFGAHEKAEMAQKKNTKQPKHDKTNPPPHFSLMKYWELLDLGENLGGDLDVV